MDLSPYMSRIAHIARKARSESKLEGELNQILKECLYKFGIAFDPYVNESLKRLGLSQIDADRPDGVFGHIVYDYKAPGTLSTSGGANRAKAQMQRYLDRITGGHSTEFSIREYGSVSIEKKEACRSWFGYITDGMTLYYCRSNGQKWKWVHHGTFSESTLLLLIHAYRALRRKPLTPELLSDAFGRRSDVAHNLIAVMCSLLANPRHRANMLFREWRRLFEQVSTYNLEQLPSLKRWATKHTIVTGDASHILFAMHSYYNLVVKILTSELLSASTSGGESICERIVSTKTIHDLYEVLNAIENEEYYRKFRITNFLEGDFFSWYMNEQSSHLSDCIRDVAREFLDFEPASALLIPETKRDLLKELYSSLVDEQIRHDLGEYYTPDWLAQHLLNGIKYHGGLSKRVLDPACGSGTFLVESITRLRQNCVKKRLSSLQTLKTVLRNVNGLDLNPLAVISARANYILSIYDLIVALGEDIEIPVYLADCINVPVKKVDDSGEEFLEYCLDTDIETFTIEIPLKLIHKQVIGRILLEYEEAIKKGWRFKRLIRRLNSIKEVKGCLSDGVVSRLGRFYAAIETLEERNWNRIWCRIIKNNFSPRGFGLFDIIVGNPPWVRWSRLPVDYRNRVKGFCNFYGLVSGRGYSGGIESDISTVITFSAADNWLKVGGTIAFLITWTVFKSDSARGFRLSRFPHEGGLRLRSIEDLTSLQPFRDASNETGIYIATKVKNGRSVRFRRIDCKIWMPRYGYSRIPSSMTLEEVYSNCDIENGSACPVGEWGTPLFTGNIEDYRNAKFLAGSSTYLGRSHRGTVSDCARVYWVKVLRYSRETNRAFIRTLTEEELPRARKVTPIEGTWIEADLLYPLVRGRDLGRYCIRTEDWYQIVPNSHYGNVEEEAEFADRYPLAYTYFLGFEDILRKRSSYRRYQGNLPFYVIYCVGDYSFSRFKVVWMEQQNPRLFRAAVVSSRRDGGGPNRLVIPDHKLYFATFDRADEAHYVCGYLNSRPVRAWLGGFLLGKQIGTTVFEHMK